MPVNTTKANFDTFDNKNKPDLNHSWWRTLRLRDKDATTAHFGYLYWGGMPPTSASVISATLRFTLGASHWNGHSHTVTAKRITEPWKESKLTWNNKPTVTATNAVSVSINTTGGTQIAMDVSALVSDAVVANAWYGIRLELDTADTDAHWIWTSDAGLTERRPELEIEWSRPPRAPVDLSPSGGRAVSISHPTLGWTFRDREGDEQAELRVQISDSSATDADGSLTTPEFDTGWHADSEEQFDTSTGVSRDEEVTTTDTSTTITAATATFEDADVGADITGSGIPAGTTIASVTSATQAEMSNAATASATITATITRTYSGISAGATRYWVVATRDVHGLTSDWSDPAEVTRVGQGTLTIDSIIDGGTVEETTPPVDTTLSVAQEAISYRLWEQQPDGTFEMVWHEWRHAASEDANVTHSFTIPPGRIRYTGRTYSIRVLAWDTEDREDTPGDPSYVRATADFTFVRSLVPSPVTSLDIVEDDPGLQLTFNRDAGLSDPDYFALVVDGRRVESRLDPTELSQGGDPIVYKAVYYGAAPRVQHTFEVEAVVDDAGVLKHSQGNVTVDLEPETTGIWLVDQTEDEASTFPTDGLPRRIRIKGIQEPELRVGESGETFHVVGRRDPVRIVDAIRGLEGQVRGTIREDDEHPPGGADFIENFQWAKRFPGLANRRWRLITGGENIPVELGEASWTPTSLPGEREYAVSVDVRQVDEFT